MLALMVHFIVHYNVFVNAHFRNNTPAGKVFRGLILSMTAFFLFDALWGVLYDAHLIALVFADTTLYFIAMAATVFFGIRYVIHYLNDKSRSITVLKYAGWVFLGFMAVTLVLNLFMPVMFWFDEGGNYHAANLRYVALAYQVLLFLSTAVGVMVTGRKETYSEKRHHLAIGCFCVTISAMVVLQVLFPLLPLYTIGCLLGGCILHTFVLEDLKEDRRLELEEMIRREQETEKELGSTRNLAYTDALTGVKSTHAYIEREKDVDIRIAEEKLNEFGVVVFDVNDLKKVNDTQGHDEGDQVIRAACQMICREFAHSPVYRVGGDEFVAFLEGDDYANRKALMNDFESKVEDNLKTGGVVVASGMAVFRHGHDNSYRRVFERADQRMYDRKGALKAMME